MGSRAKILLGIVLGTPLVTTALLAATTPIFAGATAPQFPVVCKVNGTLTFNPPLTQTGTDTTSRSAVTTVTLTGGKLNGCLSSAPATAPGHGDLPTLTVNVPATSLGRVNGVRTFATGFCPAFTFATAPDLKPYRSLVFTVTWTGGAAGSSVFVTKSVTRALNIDSEIGLNFSGKEALGSYAEKALNQITLFVDATDSAALQSGCSSGQTVTTATIDPANSVAVM
jgi:hypothetical protein